MHPEAITFANPEDAVNFLISLEGMIKAARSLYRQTQHNELPVDADTKDQILIEIENKGLALAALKNRTIEMMTNHAYPFTVIPF